MTKEKSKEGSSSSRKMDVERLKNLAISESGFLFDPIVGHSYNLNSTAMHLLHYLQSGKTRAEILKSMQKEYQADANDLERDLDQFLAKLEEYGLLVWDKN